MCLGERWISGIIVISAICLAFPRSAYSQDWLPVQPDDLTLKDNPKEPGADAMVLYRQADVDQQKSTVLEYVRVKIFTPEGARKQGQVKIPYDRADGESIDEVRARTIHSDGTVTEFDGTTFDAEIAKASGVKYLAKTFAMPRVEPGCIIEFRFRHRYGGYGYLTGEWAVQYDLYTRQARFSLKTAPSPVTLRSRPYNLFVDNTTIERSSKDSYTLEIHDLAGIEDEPLMPSPRSLSASVEFYYDSAPPHESVDEFWKRIGQSWNDQMDRFLDKKRALDTEVSQNISVGDSAETKLRKLYSRVLKIRNLTLEEDRTLKEEKQDHIRPNHNVEDVLNHGYGTALDIDFLMVGLARAAGFEATEIRVASRNSRKFYLWRRAVSDLTSPLVWVRADSKEYYLDPGSHYFAFGTLPWDESAADGIRLSNNGAEMVKTPEPAASNASITRRVALTIDSAMNMTGVLEVDFAGLEGADRRLDNHDHDAAGRKRALEDEIKGWLPAGSTFEASRIDDWDDVERPMHVEGTLTLPGSANGDAQRLMIPIGIFRTTEAGLFQSERRVNEVDFPYAYQRIDDLVIHAPAGYKVQAVPDPRDLDVNLGALSYEIRAANQLNTVEVKRRVIVRDIRYPKGFYPQLRDFFGDVKSDDSARVMFSHTQ